MFVFSGLIGSPGVWDHICENFFGRIVNSASLVEIHLIPYLIHQYHPLRLHWRLGLPEQYGLED